MPLSIPIGVSAETLSSNLIVFRFFTVIQRNIARDFSTSVTQFAVNCRTRSVNVFWSSRATWSTKIKSKLLFRYNNKKKVQLVDPIIFTIKTKFHFPKKYLIGEKFYFLDKTYINRNLIKFSKHAWIIINVQLGNGRHTWWRRLTGIWWWWCHFRHYRHGLFLIRIIQFI